LALLLFFRGHGLLSSVFLEEAIDLLSYFYSYPNERKL
jgi:hypothetical protein